MASLLVLLMAMLWKMLWLTLLAIFEVTKLDTTLLMWL